MDTHALARDDPRTPTMTLPTNKNEKPMQSEERATQEFERLLQELNILRLEGALFCLDPDKAKRRTGVVTTEVSFTSFDGELKKRRKHSQIVRVEIHPNYGQPSVSAFKVLQGVFLKMTEEGFPYPEAVSFGKRELARLAGRKGWGRTTSQQLEAAVMQLHKTTISCELFDKETKEFAKLSFSIFPTVYFSGRNETIEKCSVWIAKPIANSINKRHVAYFNFHRLNTLKTLGMVLYKRLFFHFSNLYQTAKGRNGLSFEKDYGDICREWLGGLKIERSISKAKQQLGKHLDAIKATGILRAWDIQERTDGSGLKAVFYPGDAFFEDYELYYLRQQPKTQAQGSVAVRYIQKPLELVAYFHGRLGHEGNHFSEKETAQASLLLESLSDAEARDMVDFGIERAAETRFRMEHFGAVLTYRARWEGQRQVRSELSERQTRIAACPFCRDHSGYIHVKDRTGSFTAVECPHDATKIEAYEERTGLRRV